MGRVSVAPDTVSSQGARDSDAAAEGVDLWEGDPTFLVSADHLANREVLDAVAGAVATAGQRFYRVTYETGSEVSDDDVLRGVFGEPNFVSDPAVSDVGVMVWADTKGELSEPMLSAMLRILVEELDKLDVDTWVSCPPDPNSVDWQTWVPRDSSPPTSE